MPKPICVKCKIEYEPFENGAYVAEMFQRNKIYKIWSGDIWQCPICENKIVVGFGQNPVAHHFEKEFVKKLKDKIEVYSYEKINEAIKYGTVKI